MTTPMVPALWMRPKQNLGYSNQKHGNASKIIAFIGLYGEVCNYLSNRVFR